MTHPDLPTASELPPRPAQEVQTRGKTYEGRPSGALRYHTLAGPVMIVHDTPSEVWHVTYIENIEDKLRCALLREARLLVAGLRSMQTDSETGAQRQ